ncbi:hypothetical protein BJ508DRAFT_411920 [Ascobolus immersus RN42]|uniref:Uncharacterized protein n=1 Tax=Ascobolus immersus RN42 TaxID=1160509 RepID=A0A3N4IJA2_ASCIM|nr:hypothetical protein BJ508DRAFT_411920 [Ascobolus immersus RN42]
MAASGAARTRKLPPHYSEIWPFISINCRPYFADYLEYFRVYMNEASSGGSPLNWTAEEQDLWHTRLKEHVKHYGPTLGTEDYYMVPCDLRYHSEGTAYKIDQFFDGKPLDPILMSVRLRAKAREFCFSGSELKPELQIARALYVMRELEEKEMARRANKVHFFFPRKESGWGLYEDLHFVLETLYDYSVPIPFYDQLEDGVMFFFEHLHPYLVSRTQSTPETPEFCDRVSEVFFELIIRLRLGLERVTILGENSRARFARGLMRDGQIRLINAVQKSTIDTLTDLLSMSGDDELELCLLWETWGLHHHNKDTLRGPIRSVLLDIWLAEIKMSLLQHTFLVDEEFRSERIENAIIKYMEEPGVNYAVVSGVKLASFKYRVMEAEARGNRAAMQAIMRSPRWWYREYPVFE